MAKDRLGSDGVDHALITLPSSVANQLLVNHLCNSYPSIKPAHDLLSTALSGLPGRKLDSYFET